MLFIGNITFEMLPIRKLRDEMFLMKYEFVTAYILAVLIL